MKNIFKVNIFTYLFFLLLMLSGYLKDGIIIYLILFFHELGHLILMKYFKINIKSIIFYPYGGMIKSDMLINTNSYKVLLISLGGVIIQILLFFISFLLYRFNIIPLDLYKLFLKYNTYIILFNLLPMYPLDGIKILSSILEIFISFKLSLIISIFFNFIVLILFFYYLYINSISNYLIIIFLVLSILKYIKSLKYIMNKFYLERILYKFNFKGLKSINNINKIYKNKLNYINGIREDIYLENIYY